MRADGLSYPNGIINLTNNPSTDLIPDWTPFNACVEVTIDIKPGSYPNSINIGSEGNVPVAVFSTYTFDATTIDPLTVTLASAPIK